MRRVLQMDYAQCMAEIETILGELEGNSVELDLLAVQVRRAADLLKFCNERLESVRVDVSTVVEQMKTDVDQ